MENLLEMTKNQALKVFKLMNMVPNHERKEKPYTSPKNTTQ